MAFLFWWQLFIITRHIYLMQLSNNVNIAKIRFTFWYHNRFFVFKGFCDGKMYVCRDMFLFLIPLHIGGGGDGRGVRKNVTALELQTRFSIYLLTNTTGGLPKNSRRVKRPKQRHSTHPERLRIVFRLFVAFPMY